MRSWRKTFAAAAAAAMLAACGHVIPRKVTGDGKPFDFAKPCPALPIPAPQPIEVRYLGAGNVYIRWRDDAILLGAFFSNAGYFRAFTGYPKPNPARIDAALSTLDAASVRAIITGHAHYDHIADLPEIAKKLPNASIYVNDSAMYMLKATELHPKRIRAGWSEDVAPSIHVRAAAGGHAPQLCGRNGFPCIYAGTPVSKDWRAPWDRHRLRAFGGGDTLAFAIDLRDPDGTIRYRIYYNDAAAATPLGQIEGQFDLAILTAAQWNRVRDYPRDLLQVLRPGHVMVSHYENFFRSSTTQWTFVPFLHIGGFLGIVNDFAPGGIEPTNVVCGGKNTKWTMPVPGASMLFALRPRP